MTITEIQGSFLLFTPSRILAFEILIIPLILMNNQFQDRLGCFPRLIRMFPLLDQWYTDSIRDLGIESALVLLRFKSSRFVCVFHVG